MTSAHTPNVRLDMGHIERFNGRDAEYIIPDDEALIFIDDDNEKTCHVQGEGAPAYAAFIVSAVNSYAERLAALKAADDLLDGSPFHCGAVHKEIRAVLAKASRD
jgi:hypothetical protein